MRKSDKFFYTFLALSVLASLLVGVGTGSALAGVGTMIGAFFCPFLVVASKEEYDAEQ